MKNKCAAPVFVPFTVAVDTREQRPYAFNSLTADAKDGGGLLVVPFRSATLASGDYSLFASNDSNETLPVAVERKSPQDFFGTLGQHRERFERELDRLNQLSFAKVVVECEWSDIFADGGVEFTLGVRSKLSPKTVWRSVLAWQQRFTRVHWDFVPGRLFGEATTLRTLERFWRERRRI